MKPKEGRYSVKHTVKMSQYESVVFEHSVLFDILPEESYTVTKAFADARSHMDSAIKQDLERAAQCTSYGTDETYIHDWIEEVN
jgi:hypothetical protein